MTDHMDDRVLQFRVGVLVLVTALTSILLVMYFGEWPMFGPGTYVLYVGFDEAPGVSVDTPVRKSGVLIGRVRQVELKEKAVHVLLRINKDFPITTNEICRIGTGNLFGDAVIEFVRSEQIEKNSRVLGSEDFIRGKVAQDPLEVLLELQSVVVNLEDDLAATLGSVTTASNHFSQLSKNINAFVERDGNQLGKLVERSTQALTSIDRAARVFSDLMGDEELQTNLKKSLQEVPALLSQASDTLSGLHQLTDTAEVNLRNLETLTELMGERGPTIIDRIDEDVQLLDVVLNQMIQFADSINNRQGTLGLLLNDPELYNRMNRTAGNIESVSRQLNPIINDIRIFTDKLSRDPGQLGIRGLLDGRSTGLKGNPAWRSRPTLPDWR